MTSVDTVCAGETPQRRPDPWMALAFALGARVHRLSLGPNIWLMMANLVQPARKETAS